MRYSRLLLIILWTGLAFSFEAGAAEIKQQSFNVDWPSNGNYRIGFKKDYWLFNPKITVFDAQKRWLYWAPSNYIPPAGTMMHPMGGNRNVGNKLEAVVLSGSILQLRGRTAGVVECLGKGRFLPSNFALELQLKPKSGLICEYRFDLTAPNASWQWQSAGITRPLTAPIKIDAVSGGNLANGEFQLLLRAGKGELFVLQLIPEDEQLSVTVTTSRPLVLTLMFGPVQFKTNRVGQNSSLVDAAVPGKKSKPLPRLQLSKYHSTVTALFYKFLSILTSATHSKTLITNILQCYDRIYKLF